MMMVFKRPLSNLAGLTERQAQRYSTDEVWRMVSEKYNAGELSATQEKQFVKGVAKEVST
jgi:hypothetical protein